MGNALKDQGKLDEAIASYQKVLSLKPDHADAHRNMSFALLNTGRIREGLDEYEWRWKLGAAQEDERKFSQPQWTKKYGLQDKRILLWSEQGLGDTINWSSKVPLISSQAKYCIFECHEKLVPLLSRSFPNVDIRPENRTKDDQRVDFDFHLPMGSLYRHFFLRCQKVLSLMHFWFLRKLGSTFGSAD